jgi:hypothetical protein
MSKTNLSKISLFDENNNSVEDEDAIIYDDPIEDQNDETTDLDTDEDEADRAASGIDDLDTDDQTDDVENLNEETETDKDKSTDEDNSVLKEHFNFLKDKGVFILKDDFEFDGSEETFEKAIEESFENMKYLAVQEIYEGLPDNMKDMFLYAFNGGKDVEGFKDTSVNLNTYDLTDEEHQKQVLKLYYKRKGFDDKKIDKYIKSHESVGELEDYATEAHEELKGTIEADKKAKIEEAKQAKINEQNELKQKQLELQKVLKETKDIDGIKITDKDKSNFLDFTQRRYKTNDGEIVTKFDLKMEEYLNDPKKFIKLSKFLMHDFKLTDIENDIKNKQNKDYFNKLKQGDKNNHRSASSDGKNKPKLNLGKVKFELE